MINIMIEISAYIFAAILLGYFFGWIITRWVLKNRYQSKLDEIVLNKTSTTEDNELEQNLQLKDEAINTLNNKLRQMEEKHEKEIDAFLLERVELVQKYKKLVAKEDTFQKENISQKQDEIAITNKSWLLKFFS